MRFPSFHRARTLLALASAVSLCACVAPAEDDYGTVEQGKRVDPNGKEDHLTGTVVVTVPANAPPIATTSIELHPVGHASEVVKTTLSTETSVPIGAWDIRLTGSGSTSYARVDVAGGRTTTVTLSVLAAVALQTSTKPTDPVVPTFTFGPAFQAARPSAVRRMPRISLVAPAIEDFEVYANPVGTNAGIVLVPNATYALERDGARLATVNVGPTAKVHTLGPVADAWSSAPVKVPTTEIRLAIDGSDFPVAAVPRLAWDCRLTYDADANYRSEATKAGVHLRQTGQPSAKETRVGTAGRPGCSYSLVLVSGTVPLDTTKDVLNASVYFLDVAHVKVRHENGTTREVPGTFRLSAIDGPGQPPVALGGFDYATASALPVGAGTYLVEVRYLDNTGIKTYAEQVTLP